MIDTPDSKSEATPDLSVVIVSWNVKGLLLNCLRSLYAGRGSLSIEVIVVDNCSGDGSVEALRQEFPGVLVVANRANVGFAVANNQAIRQARGRYVLLLNPDTLVLGHALAILVRCLDLDERVGVTGPKLLNPDGTIQLWCARSLPRPMDSFFEYTKLSSLFPKSRLFGRYLIGYWDHRDSRNVDCLSGACLMVRRKTFELVGLLDEGYPLYSEDTDWCHRVKAAGLISHYCAEAEVVHIGSQSSLQDRGRATRNAVFGVYRYQRKHNGPLAALIVWLLLSIASVIKLIAWACLFVIGSRPRQRSLGQIRAYWDVLKLRPRLGRVSENVNGQS